MKRYYFYSALIALALLFSASVRLFSQSVAGQASIVQHTATHNDAAGITGSSATSAATITMTPPAGQFFYLTGLDITTCQDATGATPASPTTITTTNITGSPVWMVGSGNTNAAVVGTCQPPVQLSWPNGVKSAAAGTATTFVLPTFPTHQTVRVNVYGFFAQ